MGNSTDAQTKQLSRIKQASSPYAPVVQELYVAYFGRPADPSGLANFEAALAAANAPTDIQGLTSAYSTNQAVQKLIDSFGTSKESQTLYGSGSTQDFVKAIFNNVLGRAPQTAGLDYWSNAIDSGSLSKGDAALAIMDGALTNTSAQGLIDAQLVNNRLAVAASFTADVASQGTTSLYSGAAAASTARTMLSQVDSNTDTAAFAATIASTITSLQSLPGISLVAGNDTVGSPIYYPSALVRDSSGNFYFIGQSQNGVLKLSPDGTVKVLAGSTGPGFADGSGTTAKFSAPHGLAMDGQGNIYVADTGNSVIRMVTPEGVVSTVAGKAGATGTADGTGAAARFSSPQGVAVDLSGNIFVADSSAGTIRKIAPGGVVSTVAGQQGCGQSPDGVGTAASFCNPVALIVDGAENLYVADAGYRTIRKVTPEGTVTTLAGSTLGRSDGTGSAAQFCYPADLTFDNAGDLLVSDGGCYTNPLAPINPAIRKVTTSGVVTTIAGNNAAAFIDEAPGTALFGEPAGLAVDGAGNVFVADSADNAIWTISPAGVVTLYASAQGMPGAVDGTGAAARLNGPQGIVADRAGNLFVADTNNFTIREISSSGQVTTFAGTAGQPYEQDGTGGNAHFHEPSGLTMDAQGNLYVMDSSGGKVRIVSPAGVTTTLAMPKNVQGIVDGTGIAVDGSGNVYVCDSEAGEILKITSAGVPSVIAGSLGAAGSVDGAGSVASFYLPTSLALDGQGNIYVTDTWNSTIRKVDASGNVTTIAGSAGAAGFADGAGAVARFNHPMGIVIDSAGNIYIADSLNNAIRKVTPAGVVTTLVGSASATSTILGTLPGAIFQPRYLTLVGDNTLYVTSTNAVLRIQLP